jgi:hypothetical protein
MSAPEYLLSQDELSAVRSRLEAVADGLTSQAEAEARLSILLAMDSIVRANELLRELHPVWTNGSCNYNNALDCFRMSRSPSKTGQNGSSQSHLFPMKRRVDSHLHPQIPNGIAHLICCSWRERTLVTGVEHG